MLLLGQQGSRFSIENRLCGCQLSELSLEVGRQLGLLGQDRLDIVRLQPIDLVTELPFPLCQLRRKSRDRRARFGPDEGEFGSGRGQLSLVAVPQFCDLGLSFRLDPIDQPESGLDLDDEFRDSESEGLLAFSRTNLSKREFIRKTGFQVLDFRRVRRCLGTKFRLLLTETVDQVR